MPFAFVIPRMKKPSATNLSLNPKDYDESDLRGLGFEISAQQFSDDYKLSLGGWSVSTRVTVIRITTMKLAGLGVVAALCSINANVGRYTAFSCAMCAAINFVASFHYLQIWKVRKQVYGGSKYAHYTAVVNAENEQLVGTREERERAAIFMQEELVDYTRASDWIVTLVLMSIDIGHWREFLYYASAGKIPRPPVSKEWAALCQALMMVFYVTYRFFCNEARPFYDSEAKRYRPPRTSTRILAFGSFGISCIFFVFAMMGAIGGLPSSDVIENEVLKSDVICLQLLTLNWAGYPLVSILARIGHMGLPGDTYDASWSTAKDGWFAGLDIISKGGLALVCVLKAFWMTADEENSLVEAGKLALAAVNVSVGV